MDLKLKGRVAIITGGFTGIGAAVARALAQEGVALSLAGLKLKESARLQKELKSLRAKFTLLEMDLRNPEECQRLVQHTVSEYRRIDILVNNAGLNDKIGLSHSPDDFMRSLEKNISHYFSMAHFCLPKLIKSRGCIVNIGSKVAHTGQGGTSGYVAAKGASQALTREWALDLAKHGIRVNEVVPAEVRTPQYQSWLQTQSNPKAALEKISRLIPLGQRLSTPEEIAAMVTFLSSPQASHVTGQVIHVDGGYTHLDRAYHPH